MTPIPRLHVIVGPTLDDRKLDLVERVLDAGAPCIQIRAKGITDRMAVELVGPIVDLCRVYGARSIVNDRADIALVMGASGSHGGTDDLSVTFRHEVGRGALLVGATARTPQVAQMHEGEGVDYLGVGPVYASSSKVGLPDPIGVSGLRAVVDAVTVPVIAIGGITADSVGEVLDAGAHGVAVIAAIVDAPDPAAATMAFLEALTNDD